MKFWSQNGGCCLIQYYLQFFHMEQKIREYLEAPWEHPRPVANEDPHFSYLIAYLGQLFIQGYRIIEKYPQIFLLSSMTFQIPSGRAIPKPKNRRQEQKMPQFKLVMWQITSKQIFESAKYRKGLYTKLMQIGQQLQDVQYDVIYLRECKYSILNLGELQSNGIPTSRHYFSKIKWIEEKNGHKPIMEKDEGIQLHRLVELYIKGAGESRNVHTVERIQDKNKFIYDLFKVINTVNYIVGKEVLQEDYQTMSVEKWMRKMTIKQFKRYDLLMRNQEKCVIIDWKFTMLDAKEKIKGKSTERKNLLYYQLARKDYKTDVELKFYCLHQRLFNSAYHYYTTEKFRHQIATVDIEGDKEREGEREKEKGKGKGKRKEKEERNISRGIDNLKGRVDAKEKSIEIIDEMQNENAMFKSGEKDKLMNKDAKQKKGGQSNKNSDFSFQEIIINDSDVMQLEDPTPGATQKAITIQDSVEQIPQLPSVQDKKPHLFNQSKMIVEKPMPNHDNNSVNHPPSQSRPQVPSQIQGPGSKTPQNQQELQKQIQIFLQSRNKYKKSQIKSQKYNQKCNIQVYQIQSD